MSIKIVIGDCRKVLAKMPAGSVHCVITSPPYFGLRDYQLPPLVWGGKVDCKHEWGDEVGQSSVGRNDHGTGCTSSRLGPDKDGLPGGTPVPNDPASQGQFCHHCNAWRGSLGLEPTPELYVEHLVGIFRQVWRVLRNDGTLWLNLGDTYNSQGGHSVGEDASGGVRAGRANNVIRQQMKGVNASGLKPKDLVGIPWRVVLALQQPDLDCKGCGNVAHKGQWGRFPNGRLICPSCCKSRGWTIDQSGWWLRSDIIWHKDKCMPESVRDRPTRAHEYVFLLGKSKRYYYDQDAVREPQTGNAHSRGDGRTLKGVLACSRNRANDGFQKATARYVVVPGGRNRRTVWHVDNTLDEFLRFATEQGVDIDVLAAAFIEGQAECKDVWTIPTYPFSEAHFATFPPRLVEPMIQAGTSEWGCCLECGAGWVRVAEKGKTAHDGETRSVYTKGTTANRLALLRQAARERGGEYINERTTIGWRSTCTCYDTLPFPQYPRQGKDESDADYKVRILPIRAERVRLLKKWESLSTVPTTVLDPFFGAGTTSLVAERLGRDSIGIELSPIYAEMAKERIESTCGTLFGCVELINKET